MNCIKCNAELTDGEKFCSYCGTKQVKPKVRLSKKKLLGITGLSLIVVIIVTMIIVVKATTNYQDGVVTSLFGTDYYIPKTITQINKSGEVEFNYELDTDEDSENYYLKVFAKEKSDSKYLYNFYSLNEEGQIERFNDNFYKFDDDGDLIFCKTDKYSTKNNYLYDGKKRLIKAENGKKLSYDDNNRIISSGKYDREYISDESFTYTFTTDIWETNRKCEVKCDEYNHVISIIGYRKVDYQCEYEYDSNGCITEFKYIDYNGDITERKAEYQKVSKEEYMNYMAVCKAERLKNFYMPFDALHSSLFIDVDPKEMIDYVY